METEAIFRNKIIDFLKELEDELELRKMGGKSSGLLDYWQGQEDIIKRIESYLLNKED